MNPVNNDGPCKEWLAKRDAIGDGPLSPEEREALGREAWSHVETGWHNCWGEPVIAQEEGASSDDEAEATSDDSGSTSGTARPGPAEDRRRPGMTRYETHDVPGASPTQKQWDELMWGPGREAFEAEALEDFRSRYSRGALRGMGWKQRFEDSSGWMWRRCCGRSRVPKAVSG